MTEQELEEAERNLKNLFKLLNPSGNDPLMVEYSPILDSIFEEIHFLKAALETSEQTRKTEYEAGYKKAREEILGLFDQVISKPTTRKIKI